MDNCSENNSASSTTQYCSSKFNKTSENTNDILFAIFPILDFVQFILIVSLGSLIFYFVYINKTLRDPVPVVVASLTVLKMFLSIAYLLIGISVLTDLPLLGDCSNLSGNIKIS